MRNLKLNKVHHIKDPCLDGVKKLSIDDETVYLIGSGSLYKLDVANSMVTFCTDFNSENAIEYDIIQAEFITEKQSLVIALSSGEIMLYDVITDEMECVGCITSGLIDMKWSPDLELVVFLTGENTFILMTKDFDPVIENSLDSDSLNDIKPVAVGWGSKETQFHGQGAKQAAKAKQEPVQVECPWGQKNPCISWRGDGQYFITSSVDNYNRRKLRTWSREGILQYISEHLNGLEQVLAWRPSGNVIASTQQFPNRHEVVFFEKNCLSHGGFVLPFQPNQFHINEILWNIDSSVLAIWGSETTSSDGTESNKYQVSLWSSSNYHWYRKFTLTMGNQTIKSIQWDHHHPYRLHVLLNDAEYTTYEWMWVTSCSYGQSEQDFASVAVVDGEKLLVTPFRNSVVPPPMCAFSLHMPLTIHAITFAPSPQSNNFVIILSDNTVVVVKTDSKEPVFEETCKLQTNASNPSICLPNFCSLHRISWETDEPPSPLLHWNWATDETLYCIYSSEKTSTLCCIKLTTANELVGKYCCQIEKNVVTMCSNEIGTVLAIQLTDGCILKYECDSGILMPWMFEERQLQFTNVCPTMAICEIGGKDILFGLTNHFQLYCNSIQMASDCTSFHICTDFFLYTTYQHTLHCIPLDSFLSDSSLSKTLDCSNDARTVERGSRLVTVVPCDTKVILQMPRGNLETIHPRPLLLSRVHKLLDQLNFGTSLDLMWKHRINMNLIYDHNPQVFLENVDSFVQQVDSVQKLNIFLTDISNISNTDLESNTKLSNKENSIKINTICEALRNALMSIDPEKYFLPILTTYARMAEPQLDIALKKIKSLRDIENGKRQAVTSEEALKYLLYMTDIDYLYDIALGTYDFDIVLMVAEKSNKDPKEYLPFLKELSVMEDNYRKYRIDMHLENYKKALVHISKCKDHFEDFISLMVSQRLYKDALHLFPPGTEECKKIWTLYGDYLMEKRYYEEAGLMYSRCGELEKALDSYQQSGNWNLMLSAAIQLGYDKQKICEIARNCANLLKNGAKYSEAAVLLEQYVQDHEESVAVLVEGKEWDTAIRMIYKYNHLDLIDTHLKPALLESFNNTIEMLKETELDFQMKSDRLKVVREKKSQSDLEPSFEGIAQHGDNFSEISAFTGTTNSVISRNNRTGSIITKASKSKKQAKKKYSLKEGSLFEDLALIAALSELINKTELVKGDIRKLMKTLVLFGYDNESSCLQRQFEDLLQLIDEKIPCIWLQEEETTAPLVFGPSVTSNTIASFRSTKTYSGNTIADPELKFPPRRSNVDWKLQILQ